MNKILVLQDTVNTIIDLSKVGAIRKNHPYKYETENLALCHNLICCFIFELMIGFEKWDIEYSTYEEEAQDYTRKGMAEAGKKFLADYKQIEDYLLSKYN